MVPSGPGSNHKEGKSRHNHKHNVQVLRTLPWLRPHQNDSGLALFKGSNDSARLWKWRHMCHGMSGGRLCCVQQATNDDDLSQDEKGQDWGTELIDWEQRQKNPFRGEGTNMGMCSLMEYGTFSALFASVSSHTVEMHLLQKRSLLAASSPVLSCPVFSVCRPSMVS